MSDERRWIEALRHGSPEGRWHAAKALGIGSSAEGWAALKEASKNDTVAVGSLGKISKRALQSMNELGDPAELPSAPSEGIATARPSTNSVPALEYIVFGVLCLLIASAPMLSTLLLDHLPTVGGQAHSKWLNGVYASWAFLIYFSWSALPRLKDPAPVRRREWALFFAFELMYPVLSWGAGREDRLFLLADLFSYFATCLSVALSYLSLVTAGTILKEWLYKRNASTDNLLSVGLLLVAILFCIAIPGIANEISWWSQVELPGGTWTGPLLRCAGIVTGVTGILRNLHKTILF